MSNSLVIENLVQAAITARKDLDHAQGKIMETLRTAAQDGKLFVREDARWPLHPGRQVATVASCWTHARGVGVYIHFYRADGKTVATRDKSVQVTDLEIRP